MNEYVTIREAGRRLGVQNLSDFKAKYIGFPDPALEAGSVRLWDYEQVSAWFATKQPHPRPREQRCQPG